MTQLAPNLDRAAAVSRKRELKFALLVYLWDFRQSTASPPGLPVRTLHSAVGGGYGEQEVRDALLSLEFDRCVGLGKDRGVVTAAWITQEGIQEAEEFILPEVVDTESEREQFGDLVRELKRIGDEQELDRAARLDLDAQLATALAQLGAAKPQRRVLDLSVGVASKVLEGTAAAVLVAGLKAQYPWIFGQ